jgi:hypothetical protein
MGLRDLAPSRVSPMLVLSGPGGLRSLAAVIQIVKHPVQRLMHLN